MTPIFDFEREIIQALPATNTAKRIAEAREVADRCARQGVAIEPNMDHAAIFSDPPRQITGPLRKLGYLPAWDYRCYLSPVDHHELALFVSKLPDDSPLRAKGWFEYIAAVFAIDDDSYAHVVAQEQGNPFVHHVTMGIVPVARGEAESELDYAYRAIPYIIDVRARIQQALGADPGKLILALPSVVFGDREFRARVPELMRGVTGAYQLECMQGGGFLLQFFVLGGGRVEVAMRHGTTQAFNPASVDKISTDEISVRRELLERALPTR